MENISNTREEMLKGLLVLDLTNNLAGPAAGLLLAEHGAEVIHIERPGVGDDCRYFPPILEGTSFSHMWENKGKKSITLNLKDERAKKVLRKMIEQADVLIESYRPGVMDKLGLGYEAAEKLNPRLVYCSVSSFGHRGPYAEKPGYDIIAQANSGIMYMTGEADGPPMKVALTVGDYVGALNALGGIMTALYYREKIGLGQHVDISLARGLTWFNGVFDYPVSKIPKCRSGNHADNLCPYGIFNGREGSIVLGAVNLLTWQHLCECMGRPELIDDPRYRTNADRCEHKQEVIDLVEVWLSTFQQIDDACAVLDKAGVPAAKIKSPDEVYLDPHVVECGWVQDIPTPKGIHMADSVPGCVGLSDFSRGKFRVSRAPDLGEHNEEVLTRFGMSREEIRQCQQDWS